MHQASGLDYELDLGARGFAIRNGLFNGTGEPVAVVLGRVTVEAYLLMDRSWRTPADRWDAIRRMELQGVAQARALGAGEIHCFVPPQLEKTFGRRLYRDGWKKALWPCFWREA
jgi:hypothetical protein